MATTAFVINLDERKDRWNKIRRRFINSPIQLRRIPAIQHKVGAYGLILSVICALKAAKEAKLPDVIIMEDDCLPVAGWVGKWEQIKEWLDDHPEKWEIYSGGSTQVQNPKEIGGTEKFKFYDPSLSVAAHWLYIQERSYNKIIRLFKMWSETTRVNPMRGVDILMNKLKTVVSHPFIAYQESGFSNLQKKTRKLERKFRAAEKTLRMTR